MSIKINFNGLDITVSSAAEAAAVARELTGTAAAPPKRGRPPKAIDTTSQKNGYDVEMATFDFLNAIRTGGDDGADADVIRKALKADHPKGVGSKAGMVNKIIEKLGFRVDSVYTSSREPGEGRMWEAAPKMDEAYEAIRRKISERR